MQVKLDVYNLSLLQNCHLNEANVSKANLTFQVWSVPPGHVLLPLRPLPLSVFR